MDKLYDPDLLLQKALEYRKVADVLQEPDRTEQLSLAERFLDRVRRSMTVPAILERQPPSQEQL